MWGLASIHLTCYLHGFEYIEREGKSDRASHINARNRDISISKHCHHTIHALHTKSSFACSLASKSTLFIVRTAFDSLIKIIIQLHWLDSNIFHVRNQMWHWNCVVEIFIVDKQFLHKIPFAWPIERLNDKVSVVHVPKPPISHLTKMHQQEMMEISAAHSSDVMLHSAR